MKETSSHNKYFLSIDYKGSVTVWGIQSPLSKKAVCIEHKGQFCSAQMSSFGAVIMACLLRLVLEKHVLITSRTKAHQSMFLLLGFLLSIEPIHLIQIDERENRIIYFATNF